MPRSQINTRLLISALAFGLLAGCATDLSSSQQPLSRDDFQAAPNEKLCFRIVGDFTHPDPRPEQRDVEGLVAEEAIEVAAANPGDIRLGLLAEYHVVLDNLDRGALLSGPEVDLLIAADIALETVDRRDDIRALESLRGLNLGLAVEVPCNNAASDVIVSY